MKKIIKFIKQLAMPVLPKWRPRVIKPVVYLTKDQNQNLVWAEVHHLDEVYTLTVAQIKDAIVFYIEENLQWQTQKE